MHDTTASRSWVAGWLDAVVRRVNGGRRSPALIVRAIRHARASGMSGPDIAAALEAGMSLHPIAITGDRRPRLELDARREVELSELLSGSSDRYPG